MPNYYRDISNNLSAFKDQILDQPDEEVSNLPDPVLIGYQFDDAVHCIECTRVQDAFGRFKEDSENPYGFDVHGIPFGYATNDDHPVYRIWSDDPKAGQCCRNCGNKLSKAT